MSKARLRDGKRLKGSSSWGVERMAVAGAEVYEKRKKKNSNVAVAVWMWHGCSNVAESRTWHMHGHAHGLFFRGVLSGEGSMQQHVIMSQTMIHNEPMCHVTPNNMTRSLLRYESYDVWTTTVWSSMNLWTQYMKWSNLLIESWWPTSHKTI